MHFICLSFFLDLPFACIWGPYVHPKYEMSLTRQFGFAGNCSSTLKHTYGNGILTRYHKHTNNESMSKSDSSPQISSLYRGELKLRRLSKLFDVSPWSHIPNLFII